jgi:hypothetical protein
MGRFKNIWDSIGAFGKTDSENAISQSTDELLKDGPNEWKQAANSWKENGVHAANYEDDSIDDLYSDIAIPSDERTLVKSRKDIVVVIDPGMERDLKMLAPH